MAKSTSIYFIYLYSRMKLHVSLSIKLAPVQASSRVVFIFAPPSVRICSLTTLSSTIRRRVKLQGSPPLPPPPYTSRPASLRLACPELVEGCPAPSEQRALLSSRAKRGVERSGEEGEGSGASPCAQPARVGLWPIHNIDRAARWPSPRGRGQA